ncbi:hypothetical protein [Stenotrophomonas sp. PS02301]|uniref:hypothetical protein n=1 Tax=Stenotrophomonas sp. PS02301 TaxID=2991427 RepID=UPI00249C2374|nr:hypothetical protein [Stenotrophomonas sp. PS02301]
MFNWADIAVVNAMSLAAFGFYFVAAVRYGVRRNWKSSLAMVAFSTVPWVVIITVAKTCFWFCEDLNALWITLAALKLSFWWTSAVAVTCAQLLPIKAITLPALFAGIAVAAFGSVVTFIELFQRISL